ncbi:histidine kinase [Pedobacter sp. PAMC26386]|nr:histidine kinase [Pedobacter sp. PAMC26386]
MRDRLFNFLYQYKYHLLIWSLYIAYEVILVRLLIGKFSTIDSYLFSSFFNISLFYIHAEILLKYALGAKKKVNSVGLVLLVLIELMLFMAVKYTCEILFYTDLRNFDLNYFDFSRSDVIKRLWRPVYFIGYSTGYYFLMRTRRQRLLVNEMEQRKLENIIQEKEIKNELISTQNAFLRSQINPDFLVNTLEYLYNETKDPLPKAAESILSLSDIMHYALGEEASSGYVKLENEIKLIDKFISLHQIRQVHPAHLKFSYTKESLSVKFIPLIMMTLTENILKHGQLDDPQRPAEIKITYENSVLSIETSNQESISSKISGHGIGLRNIQDRLFLTYGTAAVFHYYLDSKKYFHTSIQVQIY